MWRSPCKDCGKTRSGRVALPDRFSIRATQEVSTALPWPIVTLLRRNSFQATKGCRNLALPAVDCALSSFMQAEAAPAESDCVAREGIFARRAKTNLPMCLRRCESPSLGRFAERVLTCLDLSAAEVPCNTAPFASFSGRTEKEGPARPERIPIYEIVLMYFDETISLFQQAAGPDASASGLQLIKRGIILPSPAAPRPARRRSGAPREE